MRAFLVIFSQLQSVLPYHIYMHRFSGKCKHKPITHERYQNSFRFQRIGVDEIPSRLWASQLSRDLAGYCGVSFYPIDLSLVRFERKVISCRLLSFKVCHFSASCIFIRIPKQILPLFGYEFFHIQHWY